MDITHRLTQWLEEQDGNLVRFRRPIPLAELSNEVNEPVEQILTALSRGNTLVHHVWEHVYRKRSSRSKPYCLHLTGPDAVCLDWEDSVVGAVEMVFQQRGYETRQQLGTPGDLEQLMRDPSLTPLTSGRNLRDLWALRRRNQDVELWIIEAKGKEASGFDFQLIAEALGQLFPVAVDVLRTMLGDKSKPGVARLTKGICWDFAQRLSDAWLEKGYRPTITLAVLVPEWSPDIVWRERKTQPIPTCFYARPLTDLRSFLDYGTVPKGHRTTRGAFGQVLEQLEARVHLGRLAAAKTGLRFRLLTMTAANAPAFFRLSGDDSETSEGDGGQWHATQHVGRAPAAQ